MHSREFSDKAPGSLVDIPGGVAFVPADLPPMVPISWDLAAKLEDAARALARVDGRTALLGNADLLLRPLLAREAVESNRLEGTHTQVDDVLRAEALGPPKDLIYASKLHEVSQYLKATNLGREWIADGRPLSAFLLRALHRELLDGARGSRLSIGEFRRKQVLIGQQADTVETARFVPPPAEFVDECVANLLRFANDDLTYPPLVASAITHYQFETIHPFEDGNGRLGRLLIPLNLMQRGFISHPIVNLSPFFESRRSEYLELLRQVSTNGAWVDWVEFFLTAVAVQADDACKRADALLRLRQEYEERARMHVRSRVRTDAIVFSLERVFVTAGELALFAHCNYRTARSALEGLAHAGILVSLADVYPQAWVASEVYELVYGDI